MATERPKKYDRSPKTRDEVLDVVADADKALEEGKTAFPGLSYEEGLVAGLLWAIGDTDNDPYDVDGVAS